MAVLLCSLRPNTHNKYHIFKKCEILRNLKCKLINAMHMNYKYIHSSPAWGYIGEWAIESKLLCFILSLL